MLRLLLKITIAVTAIAAIIRVIDIYLYTAAVSRIDANAVAPPTNAVIADIGLVQLFFVIITEITFFRWIYRSNKNLRKLSGKRMEFAPGWSVGWFFIPIACLYKPYEVMKEIWRVSHGNENTGHTIVGWWWALWLISNIAGRFAFEVVMNTNDSSGYVSSAIVFIVFDGLDIVLNLVALTVVTRIGAAYSINIVEPTDPVYRGRDTTSSSSP